jgi:hypothetical protein
VVNVADALTAPAPTDAPDAVEKLMIAADAEELIASKQREIEAKLPSREIIEDTKRCS